MTNSSGTVTDAYSYTAFGELLNQTGSTTNSYLYTGQQFDSLTGLYDLRARYYNPALGRFLSQDTYPYDFSNPVELNRYSYTANDPINAVDPSGHFAEMVGSYTPARQNAPRIGLLGRLTRVLYARIVIALILAPAFAVIGDLIGVEDIVKDLRDVDVKSIEQILAEAQWREWLRLRPNPEPSPKPQPTQIGTQVPPIVATPTRSQKIVRVRHYSWSIDLIESTMLIKGDLAIWVEYPISTPNEEKAIQETTASFMRPLNGHGGFVEFNVDLNKWRMEPDPNLPGVSNAKIIWLGGPENLNYIGVGFPLSDPNVDPVFFDWQGNPK